MKWVDAIVKAESGRVEEQLADYFDKRAAENTKRAKDITDDEYQKGWHFGKADAYSRCADKLRASQSQPSGVRK